MFNKSLNEGTCINTATVKSAGQASGPCATFLCRDIRFHIFTTSTKRAHAAQLI